MFESLKSWCAKPYKEDGHVIDWLLFIGLLTCATILWSRVIARLTD